MSKTSQEMGVVCESEKYFIKRWGLVQGVACFTLVLIGKYRHSGDS